MSDWTDVERAERLAPGAARLVEADDVMIAVFNLDGAFFAVEDVCTHDGSPILGSGVDPAALIEGEELVCPHHGARFCIRDGKVLGPPAYEDLRRVPTRVQNGMVQVRAANGEEDG